MAHVRVAVRVRPLSHREKRDGADNVIAGDDGSVTIQDLRVPEHPGCDHRARYHQFRLDHCLFPGEGETPDQQQQQVYWVVGRPLLEEALAGYNGCLLAYGQSGSGKTYTMLGRPECAGMMPRLCEELLERLPALGDEASMSLSCVEVYKETVRDLLSSNPRSLRIREHPETGPYVEELGLHHVPSAAVLRDLLSGGMSRRQSGATQVNSVSSRSHALVTVHLRRRRAEATGWVNSKLHLVDLAGSERAGGAPGQLSRRRLTEGASINRSLVALGNVVSALAEQSRSRQRGGAERRRRGTFVSYRSSVLTWLLKDSLGGNAKTAMVATVSPASTSYSDTLSTLRYAERAKAIVNTPVVNDEPGSRMVLELQAEVDRLRGLLALNKMAASGVQTAGDVAEADRSFRRSRAGRPLVSGLQRASYQRLSASEPDLPSPRLEVPAPAAGRRRLPLTRSQATELPETPAAERPSPIGAEETRVAPAPRPRAASSQLSLLSADSELWDELRGITCERERRCWANFLLWEQRRGLYRPASVPGNMHRLSEERRSRRQVVREVVRRLYPGGGKPHDQAPPGDAAEPDWCCCGKRKRRREGSTESRPYEKRSRLMEEPRASKERERQPERERRHSEERSCRSPAAGAQVGSAPNASRFPRLRPQAAESSATSAPSSHRDLSRLSAAPPAAALSRSVDEGIGGSFDVCLPPTFSDDSLEPSDLGLSQDSLDMIDADSVEDLSSGKRRVDSLFEPTHRLSVVAAPVLIQPSELYRKPSAEVAGGRRKPPPDTVIRISMARPAVSSDSEWGSVGSSLGRRQGRAVRAEMRRRAEERFPCSGASDSEEESRFVSAADRTSAETLSLLTADDGNDSVSFESAPGEPDGWSTCSARETPATGGLVIHFPSPPPEIFVDEYDSPSSPAPIPATAPEAPRLCRSTSNSWEVDEESNLSDDSPVDARDSSLYTIVEAAGESDVAIDSGAAATAAAQARPPLAAPEIASKQSGGASAASAVGGRSVRVQPQSDDHLPLGDAGERRRRARVAAAAAPAAAGWIDADMWERYVSRLDVRSHLLLEEARRRPGLAVSLLVRSRSLPDLAERPAGGHVSRLFRSALSVTVHGRTAPPPDQRILYSLPPEVRERSVAGPRVQSIPEDDGAGSSGSGSSEDGSDSSGAGSEEELDGGGIGEGEERVAAALDEDAPPSPPTLSGSVQDDLAGSFAEDAPKIGLFDSLSQSDFPLVSGRGSSGDGLDSDLPESAETPGGDPERTGEVVRSDETTERLTQRIETTETHRHTGPRILTYEIVEEVNVFVRGSGETRVSTSRSASVTQVPNGAEGGGDRQVEASSGQEASGASRAGDTLEHSSRTHTVWDYRTEVLHLSPKRRQMVTASLDVEARMRDAPRAEPEASEVASLVKFVSDGSEPPSLEQWASDEVPIQEQQTPSLEQRAPGLPHLGQQALEELSNVEQQAPDEPPVLEPWAPDQPLFQEQQPPISGQRAPDQLPSHKQWAPDDPPSLKQWAPDGPPSLEQQELDEPPSLELWAPDQPPIEEQQTPSLGQQAPDEPPSLEQWAPEPPSLEQWAPDADSDNPNAAPPGDPASPPTVYVAAPLNITASTADSAAAESLPCLGSVTEPGRPADGSYSDEPTAAALSPSVPFGGTHDRVPPSPFRLITNVEDEEVQISSRQGRAEVSRARPASPTVTADHVIMTSQEPAAVEQLTAPLNPDMPACDTQTAGGDRPGDDRKAAADVPAADESRARPATDEPDALDARNIDAGPFVDRVTSPVGIHADGAAGKNQQEMIAADIDAAAGAQETSPDRGHSPSPDKLERWSCDPPTIFIFEVEEQGVLLRRDETRFIDADADGMASAPAVEAQSPLAAAEPRSPCTPVEEQFFFFKTTEEEVSLETIEEEIVEAFESSTSLSSSSSSSHSKNTSRDVDGESLRSDATGVSGAYEVNRSSGRSAAEGGSPRQLPSADVSPRDLPATGSSPGECLAGDGTPLVQVDPITQHASELRTVVESGVTQEEKDDAELSTSFNLIQLASLESPREASDPARGARDVAEVSEPASGKGGASSRSGASVSSNVQADRELEEVSGRLEVMPSSALLSKVDSEGENGTMAGPRSGSPRLSETPERPDAVTLQREGAEEPTETEEGDQKAGQGGETVESNIEDIEQEESNPETIEKPTGSECHSEVPVPRDAWSETAPVVAELSHAVSVEECQAFEVSDDELVPVEPETTVVQTPLELMSAEEHWEEEITDEVGDVPKLPWRKTDESARNALENESGLLGNTGIQIYDPAADLPQSFVDSSVESGDSLPLGPEVKPHHPPPEESDPGRSEGAAVVIPANRALASEAPVTSSGIDPPGAPPVGRPIDTDAATDPASAETGRATESTVAEMQGPAVEEEGRTVLCYADDSLEALGLELELLEGGGEHDKPGNGETAAEENAGEMQHAVEVVEPEKQGPIPEKKTDTLLCCPDPAMEVPTPELEELEGDEPNDQQEDGEPTAERTHNMSQIAAETIEEEVQGPALEGKMAEILCYGDQTMEAPTLELEQLDEGEKAEEKESTGGPGLVKHGKTQQAAETAEEEAQGPATGAQILPVFCCADPTVEAPTLHLEELGNDNTTGDATSMPDPSHVEHSEVKQAAETTEEVHGLGVEESTATVLCYADSTMLAPSLDLEDLEYDGKPDKHDALDDTDGLLVADHREKQQAAETSVVEVQGQAHEEKKATVLCYADPTMIATEMEFEMLEVGGKSHEPVTSDNNSDSCIPSRDSKTAADDLKAHSLAEAIVNQVISKATNVLESNTKIDTGTGGESGHALDTKPRSDDQSTDEPLVVTQLLSQDESEKDEKSEGESTNVPCYAEADVQKTPEGADKNGFYTGVSAADTVSQDALSRVVGVASEVHVTHISAHPESEEMSCLAPGIADPSNSTTSNEVVESAAVTRSSNQSGSRQDEAEAGYAVGLGEYGDAKSLLAESATTPEVGSAEETLEEVTPNANVVERSGTSKVSTNVEYAVSTSETKEEPDQAPAVISRQIIELQGSPVTSENESVENFTLSAAMDLTDISENIRPPLGESVISTSHIRDDARESRESRLLSDDEDQQEASEGNELRPDTLPADLVSEDVLSQVVRDASEVHVTHTPVHLEAEEISNLVPNIAEPSASATSGEAVEPVAVMRSLYQCGSEQDKAEDGRATDSEGGADATSHQPKSASSPDVEGVKVTAEEVATFSDVVAERNNTSEASKVVEYIVSSPKSEDVLGQPKAPTSELLIGELQGLPTSTETNETAHSYTLSTVEDYEVMQGSTRAGATELTSTSYIRNGTGKGRQDSREPQVDSDEEGIQEAGDNNNLHQDNTGMESVSKNILSQIEGEDSEGYHVTHIRIQSQTEISSVVPGISDPSDSITSDREIEPGAVRRSSFQCGSEQDEAETGHAISLDDADATGLVTEPVSAADVEGGAEHIIKEVPSDSGNVDEHGKANEVSTSMEYGLASPETENVPEESDAATRELTIGDIQGPTTSTDNEPVESYTLSMAEDYEEAQEIKEPSVGATESFTSVCVSDDAQMSRHEIDDTRTISIEEVLQEALIPGLPGPTETYAASDELQCHLMEEVEDQLPSLDTIESLEAGSREDSEEIFYSFDTEDETALDAMKASQAISGNVSSAHESVDFTEVSITIRDSNNVSTNDGSEEDSDDSGDETPRISVTSRNMDRSSGDPDSEKMQELRHGASPLETIMSTQAAEETCLDTAETGPSEIEEGAANRRQPRDLPEASQLPHNLSRPSEKTQLYEDAETQRPRAIRDQTSANNSAGETPAPCDATRGEEASLASFSEVSQAMPLILNRAQSISMSDESEVDDWDPPPPVTRRQPELKLDIRPRTSLNQLDGALSPREAVPQPPVTRPLLALTPTLTDITETEGDAREEPPRTATAPSLAQLTRYSHNFGDESEERTAQDEEAAALPAPTPTPPTSPVSPTSDPKVQMWQQYVELQHAADDPSPPPPPLSASDIMYLYIESAAAGSTSDLSEVGLSAAVPRHEHRAPAVRLERTVSAECVRPRRCDGLPRSSSADGLPPLDITNIIALGRLPLASPEPRDETDERRGKKCVSWSDLHGSGELEVVHGSPDGDRPLVGSASQRAAAESGESSDTESDEPDLVVGGPRHHLPSVDFGLTLPEDVRRRARQYVPGLQAQEARLETAEWDLIGSSVGVPPAREYRTARLANAATQTLRDASSQTELIEEKLEPPPEQLRAGQSDHSRSTQPSNQSHGYYYSPFSNYDPYPSSQAYDFHSSFNNPSLRPGQYEHNYHSSNYDSSHSHHSQHLHINGHHYPSDYTHRPSYLDRSSTHLRGSGSRADVLERQVRREIETLRMERERGQARWDDDLERRRRLLHIEESLQKSLQQMRAVVARRRARGRVILETLPPYQPISRQSTLTTALPGYRQDVVQSGGLDYRPVDAGLDYDRRDYEYDYAGLDYGGRLREVEQRPAHTVTHILHQEIHVPCCGHAHGSARPPAAGSPARQPAGRRMTPSQYRQHLAAIRRKILAQPPSPPEESRLSPPPAATPSQGGPPRRGADPWGTGRPGYSPLTRSEPDLTRAGVWRSDVRLTNAGSAGDLGDRLYSNDSDYLSAEVDRARYGVH